jgi:hypothetical protein
MKSCKEASFLMSKRLDTPLSMSEQISLRIHLTLCTNCRECNRHLHSIHSLCQKRRSDTTDNDDPLA